MEDLFFGENRDELFTANEFLPVDRAFSNFMKMSPCGLFDTKDDLKFLTDWQEQVDSNSGSLSDDPDIRCNFDFKTEPFEQDSGVFDSTLNTSTSSKVRPQVVDKEKILFPGDVEPLRVSSSIQTDSVLKRIVQARSVLINGERELLGKNIIGLHSLNEIKSSPEENCQITSTFINGKRYKIIIRPKSTPRKDEEMEKSIGDANCSNNIKFEPSDGLISELQNGDYDVLGGEDMLDTWQLPHSDLHEVDVCSTFQDSAEINADVSPEPVEQPRVPPLRIKIPKKMKKHKGKKSISLQNDQAAKSEPAQCDSAESNVAPTSTTTTPETNGGPRMLEAAVAIKKLLNLANNGDSVQLDHDYCSYVLRENATKRTSKLLEKNPRKDSGLESGGVSDASEDCHTPDSVRTLLAPELRNKLLEERRRSKDHQHITKMAAAIFRAANEVTSGQKKKIELPVKRSAMLDCDRNTNNCEEVKETEEIPQLPPERPKKKLKLEEYRSRRSDKEKNSNHVEASPIISMPNNAVVVKEEVIIKDDVIIKEEKKETPEEVPVVIEVPEPKPIVLDSQVRAKKCSPENKSASIGKRKVSGANYRQRRSSSSSTSSLDSNRRHRNRSVSRGRRRSARSVSRRSSSRDSSSSSGRSNHRRQYSSVRHRRRMRTRSRSLSRDKSWSRNRRNNNRRRSRSNRCFARARSPAFARDKNKPIEERRVIYVGRISEGTTNHQLRQRFSIFGPIVDISVHFRERGDNYGFVTFVYKSDAYEAVEHGNDDPTLPVYDLCFGGRRTFCKQRYSDLDGMPTSYSALCDTPRVRSDSMNFDLLLKQAKEKLQHRRENS